MLMLCAPLSLVVPMHALEETALAAGDGGEPADYDEYDQNGVQKNKQQRAEEEYAYQDSDDPQTAVYQVEVNPTHHDPNHHVPSGGDPEEPEDPGDDPEEPEDHGGDPKDTQRKIDRDENALDLDQHSNSSGEAIDAHTTVENPQKASMLDHIRSFFESLPARVQAAFSGDPAKRAQLLNDIADIQSKYSQLEKAAKTQKQADGIMKTFMERIHGDSLQVNGKDAAEKALKALQKVENPRSREAAMEHEIDMMN